MSLLAVAAIIALWVFKQHFQQPAPNFDEQTHTLAKDSGIDLTSYQAVMESAKSRIMDRLKALY